MRANGERTPTVRLKELGLILPEPPRPLGHYEAAVQTDSWLVLSGMLPVRRGAPAVAGRLGVVRATVSMTTTLDFVSHAAVADGASDLLASIFDEGHTRVVLGAYSLPLGAAILLDVIFELRPEG